MIFGVIAGQMVESTRHECKQCAFENAVEILKCLSRLEFQTLNFTLTTPTLNSPIESSGFPYSHAEIIFFRRCMHSQNNTQLRIRDSMHLKHVRMEVAVQRFCVHIVLLEP